MIISQKLNIYPQIVHGFSIKDTKFEPSLSSKFIFPEQVHGANVAIITKKEYKNIMGKADGLVTNLKDLYIGVKTADCLPILFYDPMKKIIGIAHAGWRGTLKNISREAVKAMVSLGAFKKDIIAVLGPHIKECCYDITEERKSVFQKHLASQGVPLQGYQNHNDGKFYLDLEKINYYQLLKSGLYSANIESVGLCTYHHKDLFYSYRRDGQKSGRLINFICLST